MSIESTQNDSNKYFIKEIKPNTVKYTTINDEMRIIEFKLFDDKNVEILYNPIRNMFNVSKFIKQFGKTKDNLKDLLRSVSMIRYIDTLAFHMFGQHHYLYNNNSIWNENGTMIPELLDSNNSRVIKSEINKLQNKQDNIMEKYENTSNIMKGTWMHYELFPKILSWCSVKYEILATHYQATLLPLLTNNDISLESATRKLERKTLLEEKRIKAINSIENPAEKGEAAENYVIEVLHDTFGDNIKIEHISKSKKHSGDVIINDSIMMEIKMKKKNSREDNEKFITDLLEHQDEYNMGIYLNLLDTKTPSRIEFYPNRFYINPNDFGDKFLNFIIESNNKADDEIILNQKAVRQCRLIPISKNVSEICSEKVLMTIDDVIYGILARMQTNAIYGQYINLVDIKDKEKLQRDIKRGDDANKSKELIDDFIMLNIDKFKNGYGTKTAIKDIKLFINENKCEPPSKLHIKSYLASVCDMTRQASMEADKTTETVFKLKPTQYKLYKGKLTTSDINNSNDVNITSNKIKGPDKEDVMNEYLKIPRVQELLTSDDGYCTEAISQNFRLFVQTQYPQCEITDYTEHTKNLLSKHCIQVFKNKRGRYYLKTHQNAINALNNFDNAIKEEYKKNKYINFNQFEKAYGLKYNIGLQLTRPFTQNRFKEIKKQLEQEANTNDI